MNELEVSPPSSSRSGESLSLYVEEGVESTLPPGSEGGEQTRTLLHLHVYRLHRRYNLPPARQLLRLFHFLPTPDVEGKGNVLSYSSILQHTS